MIKFLLLLLCIVCCFSQKGFAVIEVIQSKQMFQDFKKDGYTFVLQIINKAKAKEINSVVQDLKYAKQLNISADMFFIADENRLGLTDVDNILNSIPSNLYGMMWVHIDDEGGEVSCFYLKQIVQKIKSRGKKVGISTILDDWNTIMGNQCQQMSKQQLMYIGTNFQPNFDDFIPFNGWDKPALKIYEQVIEDITFIYANIYSP